MENPNDTMSLIEKIRAFLDEVRENTTPITPREKYQSDEINKLVEALAKAKPEFKQIDFNRTNSYFLTEYTDLEVIHHATTEALSKNNLTTSHHLQLTDDNISTLHTLLLHSSGQWIKSKMKLNLQNTSINILRSVVNEYKKVALMAVLDISATNDRFDDDGVVDMIEKKELISKPITKKLSINSRTISRDQVQDLQDILKEYPDITKNLLRRLKISTFSELPEELFQSMYKQAINITNDAKRGKNDD